MLSQLFLNTADAARVLCVLLLAYELPGLIAVDLTCPTSATCGQACGKRHHEIRVRRDGGVDLAAPSVGETLDSDGLAPDHVASAPGAFQFFRSAGSPSVVPRLHAAQHPAATVP